MTGFSANALMAINRLNQKGFEAFLVGGCVRDVLLSRELHDCDLTTNALPDQIKETFSDCTVVTVGEKHGTILVLLNGEGLEITTYRVDGGYSDGRHPDKVTFSESLREDLARRDFTMNAMAYHPVLGLVDPFFGEADVKKKIIRAVGDPKLRFEEDALRMLRALRFSAQLGFSLETKTKTAMTENFDRIQLVSRERILEELKKLLLGDYAQAILLEYRNLLALALPGIEAVEAGLWKKKCEALALSAPSFALRLSLLLDGLGEARVTRCVQSLKMDNATARQIIRNEGIRQEVVPETEKELLRLYCRWGEESVRFFLTAQAALGDKRAKKALQMAETLPQSACWNCSQLTVRGEDVAAWGVPKGPSIGKVLNFLLDAVIEEKTENTAEALKAYFEDKYEC